MAYAVLESPRRNSNPLDAVEQIALASGWMFDRQGDDEIIAEVSSDACHYHLWFAWRPERETLQFTCAFDLKVARARRGSIFPLLALINERLWLGHFDLASEEGMVLFRHALLLCGGCDAKPEQMLELIEASLGQCERYYPAFQLVIWAGKTPEDAIAVAMLDTVGEA